MSGRRSVVFRADRRIIKNNWLGQIGAVLVSMSRPAAKEENSLLPSV